LRRLTILLATSGLAACAGGGATSASPSSDPPPGPSVADASDETNDATPVDAGAEGGAPLPSRCTETPQNVTCPYVQTDLPYGSNATRTVLWQVPLGAPPAQGWAVAILFQGSFLGGALMWSGDVNQPFDPHAETLSIKRLLDHGYAVITPEVVAGGTTYWDTNIPPYDVAWSTAPDAGLMDALFTAIAGGTLGQLDSSRLYAAGISSGGYMTSRMAVSYAGRFKALAVHSGSYATCGGPACAIPNPLPADHPPTLFLHGQLDPAVPIATMQAYATQLGAQGIETRVIVDPNALHTWIEAAPDAIYAWFDAHP
jgi:dienelactone hydrolase